MSFGMILTHLLRSSFLVNGYISEGDEKLYTITDDIEEALHLIDCVSEA